MIDLLLIFTKYVQFQAIRNSHSKWRGTNEMYDVRRGDKWQTKIKFCWTWSGKH